MEMMLDGQTVKVYHFADEPEMPWFQARPILSSLGYTHTNMTLARLEEDERKGLKDLIEAKGAPLGGGQFNCPPLGHNEGKAIFVNEWGFYSLLLGSKKPEARAFKLWVTREVLPSIRKKGFYGDVQSANSTVALLTSTVGKLVVALNERDDRLKSSMRKHAAEQLEDALTSFSEVVASKLSGFMLSIVGHINSSVTAAVAAGLGLKKAQPRKKTTNVTEMPEFQRATPLQTGPLSLGLSTVALEMFPEMSFAAWRKIRGSFGYHAKKERLRLHALGEMAPQYVAMPLLWAYTGSSSTVEGGGARYVYLAEHRALLKRVFSAQLQTSRAQRNFGASAPTESLEQRVRRLALHLSSAERGVQWPIHVSELEPQWNEGDEGI